MPENGLKRNEKAPRMNAYLSGKLRSVSFIAMILVVFLHSYNIDMESLRTAGGSIGVLNRFTQEFISNGITRIAVPLFFLISGYLFFLSLDFSVSGFTDKFRKRFRSLAIPYLCWSLWGICVYFTLQSWPFAASFFNGPLLKDYSPGMWADVLLIHPIPYQLWFVRDLMVLVVLSPVMAWLNRMTKGWWILVPGIIWFFELTDLIIVTSESLVFFAVGSWIAGLKDQSFLDRNRKAVALWWALAWLLLLAVKTAWLVGTGNSLIQLHKLSILTGIIAAWSWYDWYFAHKNRTIGSITGYTFIIYAMHEPLLTLFQKGMFHFTGITSAASLANYLLVPVLSVSCCMAAGWVLKRYIPSVYGVVTGGR